MERIDEIGFGGLTLIQDPDEFCYGVDAVILADFASEKYPLSNGDRNADEARDTGESASPKGYGRMVDLGTGTGIIPLILSRKTHAREIWGVEIQRDSAERALRNVENNGLSGRVFIANSGVEQILSGEKSFEGLEAGSFDVVTCNPPYTEGGCGIAVDNQAKHIARHETTAGLEDFIKCAKLLLKDKGDFYMVHRPSRLVDIFYICRKNSMEPKEIQFVVPMPGEAPNILLVHCVKGGGKELKVRKELAIYENKENYSKEILAIYGKKR